MRLFKVTDEGKYEEVTTSLRLHNLDDAVATAKSESGDGGYVVDHGNGKAVVFRLQDGQLNFNPNTDRLNVARDEAPGYVYDQENPSEDVRFNSLGIKDEFPEKEPVVGNAYEEHTTQ